MSIDSTTTIQSGRSTSSCGNQIFKNICNIAEITVSGALAGHLLGVIDPVGGAVFGASYALTITIADAISDKVINMNKTALKVVAFFVSAIVSTGVGIFAATTAGFPLTVLGGIGMLLTMAVTSIAIRIVHHVAEPLFACAGGAALACKERYC